MTGKPAKRASDGRLGINKPKPTVKPIAPAVPTPKPGQKRTGKPPISKKDLDVRVPIKDRAAW